MKTGAFGWKFHDEIQPVLNEYDRWIADIRLNGAEGQLARMQILTEVDPDLGATDMFGAKGIDPISQINRTGLGNHIAMTSSLDDAAKSPPFNLRSGDLNAIRNRSDVRQGIQLGASVLAGPVMELILPELGVAKDMAHIAGKAVDVYDGMRELTGQVTAKHSIPHISRRFSTS